jgi:hypothetical protein
VSKRTEGHPPAIAQHDVALAVFDHERLIGFVGGELPDVARDVSISANSPAI